MFQYFLRLLNSGNKHKLMHYFSHLKKKYSDLFNGRRFISVDGIIGAGKSFIIEKNLKEGNCVIVEPIDLWMLVKCKKRHGFSNKNIFTEFNSRINKKSTCSIIF